MLPNRPSDQRLDVDAGASTASLKPCTVGKSGGQPKELMQIRLVITSRPVTTYTASLRSLSATTRDPIMDRAPNT